ncbi:MAG: histidine kinase dimerization/phospho-acceptor domain-containing protein, partial [Bacteroidota bacterium]
MKIRERLTLQFVILATGLLMVSSLFLYLFVQGISESQFENRVLERLKTVSAQWTIVFPRDSLRLAQIEDSRKYLLPDEQTAIFDLDGRLLFATADFSGFKDTGEILALLDREKKWAGWQGNYFSAGVSASTSDKNYYIVSGARNTEGENNLGQLRLIMVGLFVLMLAMVALTGWIFSGRALRPIHKVIANINSLSAERLDQRLPGGDDPDEVGSLVKIFNELLARIQAGVFLQKTFIDNVSHELKNPITKVVSQVEVTLLSERDKGVYEQVLRSVLEDVKEMSLLSQSLLDLSTLSHDPKSFSFLPVRIDEVLWEVREKIQALPQQYRVDFAIIRIPEDEQEMVISGNQSLLKTAFENIIENAGKYSSDRVVDVIMQCSPEQVEVSII